MRSEQAMLDYDCALKGHILTWTSSTTESSEVPPGEYICNHCWRAVSVNGGSPQRGGVFNVQQVP